MRKGIELLDCWVVMNYLQVVYFSTSNLTIQSFNPGIFHSPISCLYSINYYQGVFQAAQGPGYPLQSFFPDILII